MKYLVSWTYRLGGSGADNEETTRRGLAAFAKWSPPSSVTYHAFLGRVDGGGGFALVETDDPADLLETSAKFGFIAEYQLHPVVEIDQAVQALQEGVEFRAALG